MGVGMTELGLNRGIGIGFAESLSESGTRSLNYGIDGGIAELVSESRNEFGEVKLVT
jgi:hypothetical protein